MPSRYKRIPIIIKLNILSPLLIKKPICPARFIKNPSGGIKKVSHWLTGRASNIFQGGPVFFAPSRSSSPRIGSPRRRYWIAIFRRIVPWHLRERRSNQAFFLRRSERRAAVQPRSFAANGDSAFRPHRESIPRLWQRAN